MDYLQTGAGDRRAHLDAAKSALDAARCALRTGQVATCGEFLSKAAAHLNALAELPWAEAAE